MSSRPKTLAALLFSLTAGTAAAQPRVDATAASGASAAGGSAAASITSGAGATMAPGLVAPSLSGAPGLNPAGVTPSAPNAAVLPGAPAPAAATLPPGSAPVRLPGSHGASPVLSPAERASGADAAPQRTAAVAPRSARVSGDMSRSGAAVRDGAPSAPSAGSTLGGAARKVSEARLNAAAGGDEVSVSRALDKVFDAQAAAAVTRVPGVAGRAQNVRETIAQKVGIANTSSPADSPSLYQDAIKTAKDALPGPVSDAVAKVVRGFAAHKAEAALGDLATSAYQAAATGSASETGRLISAFDKWETLLGAPGKPLISNAAALKKDVSGVLDKAASGGAPSAPHVWFVKKDNAYTAVLPGTGVAPIPALAAAFALAPSALAPQTALGEAYRSFSADPRASTGADLIYRARRTLGASVPSAALSAARFWLRAALQSAWRRFVAFFTGGTTYELAKKSGQDALRRDSTLAATARGEAAAAERALSSDRLTAAGLRSAFGALGRAAAALEALTGDGGASAMVADLSRSFEREAAALSLRPGDVWPAAGAAFVTAPGGPAHWARRIDEEAARAVDARFWRAQGSAAFVNLGAERSMSVSAAAMIRETSPAPAALVALDDRLWARARGAQGDARLSAELRATSAGGSVELIVERGDAALARRLEEIGLTVFTDGAGLRAVVGPQDFSRDGEELALIAARALSAALGGTAAATAGNDLRDLAAETRRDPASAAKLAALLDGRQAIARAPVIGLIGEYEALAPTSVSIGGKPLAVSALRDPDTGLLSYARAAKPDGTPLGAAELRALLRVK